MASGEEKREKNRKQKVETITLTIVPFFLLISSKKF
jgi:hypothetical protein